MRKATRLSNLFGMAMESRPGQQASCCVRTLQGRGLSDQWRSDARQRLQREEFPGSLQIVNVYDPRADDARLHEISW